MNVKSITYLIIIWASVTPSLSSSPDHFPVYDIINLGTLDGDRSDGRGINNNGWVVGNSYTPTPNIRAFLFKNEIMTNLGTLDGERSEAYAINDYGEIVGSILSEVNTGFLWDPEISEPNGFVPMQDLPELPGGGYSYAYDINNHKQIVGSSDVVGTSDNHAVLWQNDTVTDLGTGTARAINENGQIVGSAAFPGSYYSHATLFDPNGTGDNLDLGTLGGDYSSAEDINNKGQVVGMSHNADGSYRAFLWEKGSMTDLGTFGWAHSTADSINDNGQIVGRVMSATYTTQRGFLWNSSTGSTDPDDPNNGFIYLDQLYDANLPSSADFYVLYPDDINNNGQITGTGKVAGEGFRAFLMTPQSITKYTLTVETEPNTINTVNPSVGPHQYYEHSIIPVSAQSSTDCPYVYYFTEWQGDVMDPNSADTHVLIDGDKTIRAIFDVGDRVCGDLCHPILQGDLNEDCYVNMADFALYMESWLACTHPDCDEL